MEWYIQIGEGVHGPYDVGQLLEFTTDGIVRPETLMWEKSCGEWISAAAVPYIWAPLPPRKSAIPPPLPRVSAVSRDLPGLEGMEERDKPSVDRNDILDPGSGRHHAERGRAGTAECSKCYYRFEKRAMHHISSADYLTPALRLRPRAKKIWICNSCFAKRGGSGGQFSRILVGWLRALIQAR